MTLPDFRNLGVMLRCLVLAEFSNALALVAYAPDGFVALLRLPDSGLLFEASVLCVLLSLFLLSPLLHRTPYRYGVLIVVAVAAFVSVGLDLSTRAWIGESATGGAWKASLFAVLLSGLFLAYFNWRQRIMSPALADARLLALQARVRPHFLFNSLNTAVSLIRDDAKKAEEVLLDMADLFRVLLAESGQLVPLADEIELANRYIEIEQHRLGGRLRVHWDCQDVPFASGVPLLMLQPLLENAVSYGIEPFVDGGDIVVRVRGKKGQLQIEVENSISRGASVPVDSRFALANLDKRLALHFDAEAAIDTFEEKGRFTVRLTIPFKTENPPYDRFAVRSRS